jgi:hypothetical protein
MINVYSDTAEIGRFSAAPLRCGNRSAGPGGMHP